MDRHHHARASVRRRGVPLRQARDRALSRRPRTGGYSIIPGKCGARSSQPVSPSRTTSFPRRVGSANGCANPKTWNRLSNCSSVRLSWLEREPNDGNGANATPRSMWPVRRFRPRTVPPPDARVPLRPHHNGVRASPEKKVRRNHMNDELLAMLTQVEREVLGWSGGSHVPEGDPRRADLRRPGEAARG